MRDDPLLERKAETAATIEESRVHRNRWIIAFTVTLASMLELLDSSIVNVSLPDMMGNLGATLDEVAWVVTGYVVANAIVIPISGWLSALLGRKRYFAASLTLFTVSSFFCGGSSSLVALVFWRILQGLGGGALLATSQATLYEIFPPEEYGKAQAIFGMGVVVGPTLGPTLGGYLTDSLSWHWIFYVNVPLGLLAILLTLVFLPDSRYARRAARVDGLGLMLLLLAIGCLQILLERGERLEWFDSREVVSYALVSGCAFVGLVWHELRTPHPVVNLRVFRSRQLTAGVIIGFVLGVCMYATVFVVPVYLQTLLGYTAWQTGLALLPGALATAIMNGVMARAGRSIDRRLLITAGVLIFTFSMWKWSQLTVLSGGSDFFWPLVIRGVALGFIFVPLSNLSLAALPKDELADGSGLYNLARQLGGSVGVAASATLIARLRTIHHAQLVTHVSLYDPATRERLTTLMRGLVARGSSPAIAERQALQLLDMTVGRQAATLAFEQIFLLFGFLFLSTLPLLLMARQGAGGQRGRIAH